MRIALALVMTLVVGADAAAQAPAVTYRGRPLSAYAAEVKAASPEARAAALRAIGQFGKDGLSALPVVTVALADADGSVRQAAAETVAIFGPQGAPALASLAPLLSDPDPRMRVIAALALREIGAASRPALPQLIAALKDEDLVVRMTVALAIGTQGKEARSAVPALIAAGNDRADDRADDWVSVPLRDMRRAMAWALGEIGPDAKDALPTLYEWTKFYRVAWVSIPAIAKIEGKPVPPTWR